MAEEQKKEEIQKREVKYRRYYTPREVSQHNCAEDLWVSISGRVYDLSEYIAANRGQLAQPIIQHAGEDLSHWFDKETGDVKTHIDPKRHIKTPFLPYGRFLDVPPPEPVTNWNTIISTPWWKNDDYHIGSLTRKTRFIEVVNVLTHQSCSLEVCSEETIDEIQDRYLELNAHARSYTWKMLEEDEFVPIDMSKTLSENGIYDDTNEFERLGIDENDHKPILHVYYNDDLTEM